MAQLVLVAGASGALGRHAISELKARGYRVRALTRNPERTRATCPGVDELHPADALEPATLRGACEGAEAVFSCLGAAVSPSFSGHLGRKPFSAVDYPANRNLLEAALAARVSKFVYVSALSAEKGRHLDYMDAHERVVDALRASGMDYAVLRPAGFFSAMGELVDMARKGALPVLGDGSAKTNPIHEADLAALCADAVKDGTRERDIGGPETFTRKQIAEMAFAALGRPPKLRHVPAWLARAMPPVLRLVNPRVAAVTAFLAEVTTHDSVAPAYGTRRLEAYFRDRAAAVAPTS
jgi:uncharacterized protein YbjT (DUF2867 family)